MSRMDMKGLKQHLSTLYDAFDHQGASVLQAAVCRPGCADCCTEVGEVGITTLEAYFIHEHVQRLPTSEKKLLERSLKDNRILRNTQRIARCPFLNDDKRCRVYSLRPFSCRRLYSLKLCGQTGPTVHRDLWKIAEEIERSIQILDSTGYSGHISHVLYLLKDPRFLKTYLSGGFAPDEIRPYCMEHGLRINRHTVREDQCTSFNSSP